MTDIQVGDRVRLTAQFLRSTDQKKGPDGAKTWIVKAVRAVGAAEYVYVNEAADTSWYSESELKEDPLLKYRAINAANLYRVGTLTVRNVT